ncbi:ADP-ribosylation factor-like protein 16 [Oppia nitens]|uniref:ADP-ribosylation factor-like protein 16 n=1 Tax=Oppia nitens TaxID=1686743 RepID=UPI0023DC5C04|nr:ADP-ribosylation factor-like protein 16 [Oppia nitens]
MILCVGQSASGKSLLLKRLQNIEFQATNYLDIPSTVPTVGTNIGFIKTKSKTITIEEVGGSMAEIWHQYYSDSQTIVFVVDSTNMSTIGDSCVLLCQMLSDTNVINTKHILVILNKCDKCCNQRKDEIMYLLMIDNLIQSLPNQQITVYETSCLTGKGLQLVYDWILRYN